MYTQMIVYAFWAVIGLVLALYLFVQLIRLTKHLKTVKRNLNRKKIQRIEKKVDKKIARSEEKKKKKELKKYNSQTRGEDRSSIPRNEIEGENDLWYEYPEKLHQSDNGYPASENTDSTNSKLKLGDRIYKKHSWTRLNCELDDIDHDDLVFQMQRRQDNSYNFLQNLQENTRIQEEQNRIQNDLNQF